MLPEPLCRFQTFSWRAPKELAAPFVWAVETVERLEFIGDSYEAIRAARQTDSDPNETEVHHLICHAWELFRTLGKGLPLLQDVEEEFAASAIGLASLGRYVEPSFHRLVFKLGSVCLDDFVSTVQRVCKINLGFCLSDSFWERVEWPEDCPKGWQPYQLRPLVMTALKTDHKEFNIGISTRSYRRLTAALEQELCRTWKRKYPSEEAEYVTLRDATIETDMGETDTGIPLPPRMRPSFARDHLWLKWNEEEGLTPARIRDRWNKMTDIERRRVAEPQYSRIGKSNSGREVVKKALQRAKGERDS